jgi:crotonobetainyl-CoA:carnitine CoA-transferase CaiB-like acyl-CoA transferase
MCDDRCTELRRSAAASQCRAGFAVGLLAQPVAASEAILTRCAEALGHPVWRRDPRFATNQQRMQNRAAFESLMEAALTANTTEHWVAGLEAAGVPCGPVYNYVQIFADPRLDPIRERPRTG